LGVRIPIWILLNLDRDPDFQHCRERVWREERRNFPSVLLLFLFIISSCHIPLLFLFFPSYTPPFSLLPIIYPSFFSSSRHILLLFLFFPSYTPPFSLLPVIYSSLFSSSRHILLLFSSSCPIPLISIVFVFKLHRVLCTKHVSFEKYKYVSLCVTHCVDKLGIHKSKIDYVTPQSM
jgi:hypothetical protein